MKRFRSFLGVVVVTITATGCAGSGRPVGAGLQDVVTRMGETSAPTAQEYEAARAEFLASANATMIDQERRSNSSAAKVKKGISSVGAVLGLGGTVAGFIVDGDSTKKTISQWSAAVAGVSGILGLLPIGGDPKPAAGIARYLRLAIPRFETRWPAALGGAPSAADWREFMLDAGQISSVVGTLGR